MHDLYTSNSLLFEDIKLHIEGFYYDYIEDMFSVEVPIPPEHPPLVVRGFIPEIVTWLRSSLHPV